MSGKQISMGLLNLIIDLTSYIEGKMDKYKLHFLLIFAGMIIGQIIRWII
jgi:hypothetical protein